MKGKIVIKDKAHKCCICGKDAVIKAFDMYLCQKHDIELAESFNYRFNQQEEEDTLEL